MLSVSVASKRSAGAEMGDRWGCLFWIWLYLGIIITASYHHLSIRGWLIYTIIFVALALLWNSADQWRERRRLHDTVCPHGVKGGQTLNRCETCRQEEEERARCREIERQNAERKAEIQKRADNLRREEIQRLTKARLKKEEYLLSLSPNEFEDAVAAMFRKLGYSVKQTPFSADRGRDAVVTKDGRKYVIECKRYGTEKSVGRPALQKFFAAMKEEKAVGGFFVTTGRFAKTAVEYAEKNAIELIPGNHLVSMMHQAFPESEKEDSVRVMCLECGEVVVFSLRSDQTQKRCRKGHLVNNDFTEEMLTPRSISSKMYCERCGKEMHIIKGRRGKFWGCKGYPECRNTKPYSS